MAILFALAAAIGWGSSDYAGGHASRRSSAVSVVILTHLASLIALIVIATMPGQTGSPGVNDLLWGLAAGLGGGFGAMLLFSGLGKGTMSVVAPITAVGAAIIPVIAGVLQGESLSTLGMFGILLAFVAIVLVSLSPEAATLVDGHVDPDVDGRTPVPPGGGPIVEIDDLTIAAMEAQFQAPVVPEPSLVPAGAPAGAAASWSAPVGGPVNVTPPVAYRSLNEFAVAVHEQRDAFEIARITGRPYVSPASASELSPQGRTPSTPVPSFALGSAASTIALAATAATVTTPTDAPTTSVVESDGGIAQERAGGVRGGLRKMLGRPGVIEALFSGLGFGLFFVFIARTSEEAGHWPLVGARFISVVMFAAGAIIALSAVMPHRDSRRTVILAGLLDAAAAVFFVLATRSGLLSIGAVLASLYPAITVLLARFVGKERITRVQLGGLVLAGGAVTLLVL
ncbi:MAG: EamA family transporter [Ilumatobacter sp.]|uniref:EamA family transporter n=1 Tax=Ilumatobacter sp. TaxID=1967498 RepID=UPI003919E728